MEELNKLEVRIENFTTFEVLKKLKIPNKYDLLGLYQGIPLPTQKSEKLKVSNDTIYLYRAPIIKYALENKENIISLVRYVLLHEISHHFGCERSKNLLSLI